MSLRLSFTVPALALFLISCDSGVDAPVQPQAELSGEKEGLTGEIDRSFAGELMPTINVRDPQGNILNLGALQGKPALINLWATWCAPCVIEMPMLDNLADQMGDDLRVVTISQDLRGAELVGPFFEANQYRNLEPWLDPEGELGFAFGGVMPTTILYDANGQELFRVLGGYHWDSEEARAAITEAIAE